MPERKPFTASFPNGPASNVAGGRFASGPVTDGLDSGIGPAGAAGAAGAAAAVGACASWGAGAGAAAWSLLLAGWGTSALAAHADTASPKTQSVILIKCFSLNELEPGCYLTQASCS